MSRCRNERAADENPGVSAPIKLVISDVDGTLVRHDKSLAEATIAAVKALADAGVPMTLVSARPPSGVLPLADRLGITLPIGAYNGGTLVQPTGVVVETHRIDRDIAGELLRLTRAAGADPWIFADGRWHITNLDNPHVPRERLSAGQEPVVRGDLTDLLDRVDKMVAVSDDAPLLAALQEHARQAAGAAATVALSQPYFLDMTAPQANKGDGVVALAKAAGVPLDQVAVLGDMPNDLPMFACAGFAVAMGQAPAAVRDAADAVSTSNDDDGVAHAIETILLPRIQEHAT